MDSKQLPITSVRYWKEKFVAIWLLILMFLKAFLPTYNPNSNSSSGRNNLNRGGSNGGKPQNLFGMCGAGG